MLCKCFGFNLSGVWNCLSLSTVTERGAWSLPAEGSGILRTLGEIDTRAQGEKETSRRWTEEEEGCLLVLLHLLFAAAAARCPDD